MGIAKTGTMSVAKLLANFNSAHEYKFQETAEKIVAFHHNEISEQAFLRFVLERDGSLNMDSSSYNHFYVHILKDAFPQAKFILTIRDCYSWLDSIVNMFLRWGLESRWTGVSVPDWMLAYSQVLFGQHFDHTSFMSVSNLQSGFSKMLDGFILYWAESNKKLLEVLPPERTLVLRTNEISKSLEPMANFLGISPQSLQVEASHSHKARKKADLTQFVDRYELEKAVGRHGGDLMDQFFR